MAKFEIVQAERMRSVKITLQDETVRAEAGALNYMTGNVRMSVGLPGIDDYLKAALTEEALIRPWYTGTGEVYLEPSLGGFHIFELGGEEWVLQRGAYWASDGSVELAIHRERMSTSFWSGEGLIDFQTRVKGEGKVVLAAQGPVELREMNEDRLAAEGSIVLARTRGIRYTIQRASKNWVGNFLSGESALRVYEGTGKLLVSPVPYWVLRPGSSASQSA